MTPVSPCTCPPLTGICVLHLLRCLPPLVPLGDCSLPTFSLFHLGFHTGSIGGVSSLLILPSGWTGRIPPSLLLVCGTCQSTSLVMASTICWGIALSSGVQVFLLPVLRSSQQRREVFLTARRSEKDPALCTFSFWLELSIRRAFRLSGRHLPGPSLWLVKPLLSRHFFFLRSFCCQPGVEGRYMTTSHHIHAS